MKLRYAFTVVGLCFFSLLHVAVDRASADTLSRGRRIILDRGIQIQAMTLPLQGMGDDVAPSIRGRGITSLDTWLQGNFTTLNLWQSGTAYNLPLLAQLPAGTQWSRNYEGQWGFLQPAEVPYLSRMASFQFWDEQEQTQELLDLEKTTYAAWQSYYPNTLIYTNFAVGSDPAYGPTTLASLQQYMLYTNPDMISLDYYPSYSFPQAERNNWYSFMQRYRTAGLLGNNGSGATPIPYAQFLNSYRPSYTAATPSESYVRLQQNASWAFGYSMVSYFVYNGWVDEWAASAMFDSASDNQPNAVFNYVAETNRQSRNLSPALVRLVSTDIRMIPGKYSDYTWWQGNHIDTLSLPSGISQWASGHLHGDINGNNGGNDYITGITPITGPGGGVRSTYSDVLIGYFKPLLDGNPGYSFANGLHFMIVNGASQGTAAESAQWYHLTFDFTGSEFDSLVRLSRNTGKVELVTLTAIGGANYSLNLYLPGGTGDLFAYWDSSDPLPSIPEPNSFVLLVIGGTAFLAWGWRRGRSVVDCRV